VDDALKTRRIIYLNVETSLLFAPPIKISGYVPGSESVNLTSSELISVLRTVLQLHLKAY